MNIGLTAAKNNDISSSAITLLNHIFQEAAQTQASDIHFDSSRLSCSIKFRIKGTLKLIFSPPKHLMPALLNRLKIMAQLNIAEQRLPQDGQIDIQLPHQRQLEARLSTIPTFFGEKASLRLFHHGPSLCLSSLGFQPEQLQLCLGHLQKTSGLILVAGPTGSGKTTTLYAFLDHLKQQNKHLMSIENPVERSLEGVNQININEPIGLDFDHLLSASLRHDPDILMIGEIRDKSTALAAIKAAETGHLVLSSIHAGSSYEVLLRLLHLGVEKHFLASVLHLLIHQRLLPVKIPHAIGNRMGIFECLTIDEPLRLLLMTQAIQTLKSSLTTNLDLKKLAEQAYERGDIESSEMDQL